MFTTGTTQSILDWSRSFIADPKTRVNAVRKEIIGRTTLATSSRETFYIKRPALGTVSLYVEPYQYSSSSTLNALASTDMKFLYNATLQSCTFPSEASDTSIRPAQFKNVYAEYEYTESLPYAYRDTELVAYLPQAAEYLNNNYSLTYAYTGTINNFAMTSITLQDKEVLSRALALVVRKSYVSEQMKRGLGVSFRGPMAAIDSKTQLNAFNAETKALKESIDKKVDEDEFKASSSGAQTIDVYDETVVLG